MLGIKIRIRWFRIKGLILKQDEQSSSLQNYFQLRFMQEKSELMETSDFFLNPRNEFLKFNFESGLSNQVFNKGIGGD